MPSKQIRVRIYPDGRIEADVMGIKGKGCTDYISILEQLLDAETIDSEYTAEYYESEQTALEQNQIHSTEQNQKK
ncbi:DUF2997 domain-containing protein [Paenibacillus algorifonticola]|uniref:DUF2997 domain-containing protein n=1 Tax=Paenibacillus algorifonticola TaxID=684063 RepID=UPI003D265338